MAQARHKNRRSILKYAERFPAAEQPDLLMKTNVWRRHVLSRT